MKNVLILATVLPMLIVKLEITEAFAHVGLVIQEILILKDVDQFHHLNQSLWNVVLM